MSNNHLTTQTQGFIQSDVQPINSFLEDQTQSEKTSRSFTIWTAIIMFFAGLIFCLNAFVFVYTDVVGTSMLPTLRSGDKLVASKYKDVEIGSIVIVEGASSSDKLIIKRVIAMGGDTVEIKNGSVWVNGSKLTEPYVQGKTDLKDWYEWTDQSVYTLKEDEVFYLGDNRIVSADSRAYGPCKESQILAVVTDWSLWLNDLFN